MRVLLTNYRFADPTGSELYVRDVALGLLARGQQPIVYSRNLGPLAADLRRSTIPVLDDLDRLEQPPELIHAQHHLEAMTALARFPGTPAVYVCHGFLPDEEAPPAHPRIHRYVAVDELTRRRLLDECGIPAARTEVVLNFVDLERFARRPPLPERPRRALVFSNYAHERNYLPLVRRACVDAGLEFEAVGRQMGRPTEHPEAILLEHDIVFAKGRAALEAAAVGTAVILCDDAGLGPMVTASELDQLRAYNFGVRLLRRPVTEAGVAQELARYDPVDAAEVARRMRSEAGLGPTLDRLLQIYAVACAAQVEAPPSEDEEARAFASYFRRGPLVGGDFHRPERELLQAAAARSAGVAEQLRALLDHQEERSAELCREKELLGRERDSLRAETARLGVLADELRSRLDEQVRQAANVRAEIQWMANSATWRWRERLVEHRWLVAAYRGLMRLVGSRPTPKRG